MAVGRDTHTSTGTGWAAVSSTTTSRSMVADAGTSIGSSVNGDDAASIWHSSDRPMWSGAKSTCTRCVRRSGCGRRRTAIRARAADIAGGSAPAREPLTRGPTADDSFSDRQTATTPRPSSSLGRTSEKPAGSSGIRSRSAAARQRTVLRSLPAPSSHTPGTSNTPTGPARGMENVSSSRHAPAVGSGRSTR